MKNIKEILFEEEQSAALTLTDGAGIILRFEQVYATEQDGEIYCILRPLATVKGLDMQSAIVFSVNGNTGKFRVVKDFAQTEKVFAEYYEELRQMQRRTDL